MSTSLLHRYAEGDTPLARLQDHAARLGRLQHVLVAALSAQCGNACHVANLKEDILTVSACGSAVAVRLKQMIPSLLDHFARAGYPLRHIQVKVRLPEPSATRRPPPARVVSDAARAQIGAFAATLPPDAPLRATLETLVRRSSSPLKLDT
ncbi:MAG: DUF721 domain-containing protein [Betaproteobacteria bacterium]|nr:DUF721 domain-containing protein [Betaproteobacteria bacterium]